MQRVDAVIIGAGLDGLTAGAYLARAGRSVLLIERADTLGGHTVDAGLEPGFRHLPFGSLTAGLDPRILRDLDLAQHGVRLVPVPPPVSRFDDGRFLASYGDGEVNRREMQRLGLRDADAWPTFVRDLRRALERVVPQPEALWPDHWRQRKANAPAQAIWEKWRAGDTRQRLSDLRLWSLSLDEYLSTYFESEHVRAHLAAIALRGRSAGPFTPYQAIALADMMRGPAQQGGSGWPTRWVPLGGWPALANGLAAVFRSSGGLIRTEAEATEIILKDRKAAGVILADGETIEADLVLSTLDAKTTFSKLFDWADLPDGFLRKVQHIRQRGLWAQLNLSLARKPSIEGIPDDCPALAGGIILNPGLVQMEYAYDDWNAGKCPQRPLVMMEMPSLLDPGAAPDGQHVLSLTAQYIPYTPDGGRWTEARRDDLKSVLLSMLHEVSPGIEETILSHSLQVPPDCEERLGLTQGDLAQGEIALDQLYWNRPMPELASHATPIAGLYLAGAGGGAPVWAGRNGANAARTILDRTGGRNDAF